ncbi:MAG: hypothetical protein IT290_06415 [Deltaproteobacteria bacterium]|nr:hypothetical protein [Deltaproteobacteria bacterium]
MQTRSSRSLRSSIMPALVGLGLVGALIYSMPPLISWAFAMLVIPTFVATRLETEERPRFAIPYATVGAVFVYVRAETFRFLAPGEHETAQMAATVTLCVALVILASLYQIKASVEHDNRWLRATYVAFGECILNLLL